jgi:DNA-binding CsgD family transcriptional regulator
MEAGVTRLAALSPDQRKRLETVPLCIRQAVDEDGQGTLVLRYTTVGYFAAAKALAERVIAATPGRTAGCANDPMRGDTYLGLARAYTVRGQPTAARQAYQQAVAEYRAVGHHWMIILALAYEIADVHFPFFADDIADRQHLLNALSEALPRMVGINDLDLTAASLRFLAPARWLEGDWEPVRRAALVAMPPNRVPETAFTDVYARLACAQGHVARAWEIIRWALPLGLRAEPGNIPWRAVPPLQRVGAMVSLQEGNLPAARQWLEAHDRWLDWSDCVPGRAEGHALWAQYHHAAGDAAQAYDCATAALARATEPRQPLAMLAAHRILGELDTAAGHFGAAQAHLDASLGLTHACAVPYERALTLLARVELHAANNERNEAATLLNEARAILLLLEASPALARADALAVTRPLMPAYPAGLSAREVEVLRLLAAGHTNRQIADKLLLSERTVHVHVRNIFTKTGADNRAGATAFAFRHNLA